MDGHAAQGDQRIRFTRPDSAVGAESDLPGMKSANGFCWGVDTELEGLRNRSTTIAEQRSDSENCRLIVGSERPASH